LSAAKPITLWHLIQSADGELSAQLRSRRKLLFFTVNLADRRSRLLTEQINALRSAFRDVRARHPLSIEAIVVLPDHLHAIWTLPDGDADFALRWRLLKSTFSRSLPEGEQVSASRRGKGERGIWQRRYWEHTLRDESDYAAHMDFIHFNPVRHAHVSCRAG
jgi:putative transposase